MDNLQWIIYNFCANRMHSKTKGFCFAEVQPKITDLRSGDVMDNVQLWRRGAQRLCENYGTGFKPALINIEIYVRKASYINH